MKTVSLATARKFRVSTLLLATGLLSSAAIAPQALAAEYSNASNEASTEAYAAPDKPQQPKSKTNKTGQKNPKSKAANGSTDDEEKSTTEKLQEGFETAKDAYDKVGSEILNGNYGKALDGAVDMAQDKMIEKAEDALKKKNETLYKAYKLGKDVKDDVLKGDYAEVWKKTKDAAYDEAKDFVEDKLIEKIIPGYGQLKGAWDTGYATGELIGQIPISADGRTVNDLAESQMRNAFYSGKDNATSKQNADEEIIQAFIKSVKNGDVGLPEGMNFGETSAKIRFNLDYGFSPFDAIELTPGAKERKLLAEQAAAEPDAPDTPVPAPKPVELDPWALDPAPRKATPQDEAVEPREQPTQDIWTTDDDNSEQLDEERYRLQQQLEAEKARDRAIADNQSYQKFAAAEAKREEEARVKAEKAREFQEGMNALAQGLGQVAQQIQQAQQGGVPQSSSSGTLGSNGKRAPTAAEKAAAIYQMCVRRTGDQKGCRSMAGTGVKLDSDLNNGKIPMDFIKKVCRDAADSQKNYDRCVADKVAEMKQRMGQR